MNLRANTTTTWLAAGALLLITVVAYLPAVGNGFIWDDDYYVTENQALRDVAGLGRIWFKLGTVPQYYPVTHTTFWIEYQLGRLIHGSARADPGSGAPGGADGGADQVEVDPTSFHVVNILLHGANAVLWWLLLCRLGLPAVAAYLAAAVFALHPVHVESVAWITERKNVLSGLMYLAAALAYLKFDNLEGPAEACAGVARRWRWWEVALLLYLLALLSKSVTATLPAALLLAAFWRQGCIRWRTVWPVLPFFAVGILMGLVTLHMERSTVHASGPEWDFSAPDRFLIAGRALWFYVGKLLWPANLTFSYPRWQIDDTAVWQYVYPVAVLAALVALWRWRRRIGRGPLVGVLFFAGTLVPALGFFNVFPMLYSFVADHFQYLASMGAIALAAGAAAALARRWSPVGMRLGLVVAVAVLVLLGTLTWRQTQMYRNVETLWQETILRNPQSWMAYNNLGTVRLDRGDEQGAEALFRKSVDLNPDNVSAIRNLGSVLVRRGQVEAGIERLRTALTKPRGKSLSHAALGAALLTQRDYRGAAQHLGQALELSAQARRDPDLIHDYAVAEIGNGRPEHAIRALTAALRLSPDDPDLRRALAEAYRLQAQAGFQRGDMALVIAASEQSLTLQPDQPVVHRSLAWILATHPDESLRDGAKAVHHASQAVDQTGGNDPVALDTLAAAYAEAGRFDEAVAAVSGAIELAERAGAAPLAAACAQRRELYRAHRPYRTP